MLTPRLGERNDGARSCRSWLLSLVAVVALAWGGGIYLAFRSTKLRLFAWNHAFGLEAMVHDLREAVVRSGIAPPAFVVYSLPDGLWLLSLLIVLGRVWAVDRGTAARVRWGTVGAALGHEGLQALRLNAGTGCWIDVACYFAAGVLSAWVGRLSTMELQR